MANTVADMSVRIGADTRDAEAGLQRVGGQFAGTAKAGAGLAVGMGLMNTAFRAVKGATVDVIATGAAFEKQMDAIAAATRASGSEMAAMEQIAKDLGASTSFSASEAASAENVLARAGIGVNDILGGALAGTLDLAASDNLDLATAATIAAQAMSQFGLAGKDMAYIADVLASASSASSASVASLGAGMSYVGGTAHSLGISLQDTAGAMALFANHGLEGSRMGTVLSEVLTRLNPRSTEAADTMKALGISFFDAKGQFIGVAEMAGVLRDRLGNLSDAQRLEAIQTIFGMQAMEGINAFMAEGAEGTRKYAAASYEVGRAHEMAGTQTANLAGEFDALKGKVETLSITIAQDLTPALSVGIELLSDLVDMLALAVKGFEGLGSAAKDYADAAADFVFGVDEEARALGDAEDAAARYTHLLATAAGPGVEGFGAQAAAADVLIQQFNNALIAGQEDLTGFGAEARAMITALTDSGASAEQITTVFLALPDPMREAVRQMAAVSGALDAQGLSFAYAGMMAASYRDQLAATALAARPYRDTPGNPMDEAIAAANKEAGKPTGLSHYDIPKHDGGGAAIKEAETALDRFNAMLENTASLDRWEAAFGDTAGRVRKYLEDALAPGAGTGAATALMSSITSAREELERKEIPGWQALGANLMSTVATAMNEGTPEAIAAAETAMAAVNAALTNPAKIELTAQSFSDSFAAAMSRVNLEAQIGSAGMRAMDAFHKAITDGGQKTIDALAASIADIQGNLKGKLGPEAFAKLGADLMGAFTDMVTKKTPAAEAAFQALMAKVEGVMKGGAYAVTTGTVLMAADIDKLVDQLGLDAKTITSHVDVIVNSGILKMLEGLGDVPEDIAKIIQETLDLLDKKLIDSAKAGLRIGNAIADGIARGVIDGSARPSGVGGGGGHGGGGTGGLPGGDPRDAPGWTGSQADWDKYNAWAASWQGTGGGGPGGYLPPKTLPGENNAVTKVINVTFSPPIMAMDAQSWDAWVSQPEIIEPLLDAIRDAIDGELV